MKRTADHAAFPVTHVVVMMAFLSAIFLADANLSFAASNTQKAPEVARVSAVDRTEARITQLQAALKITDDQKELWSTLTLVMRDNAKEMDTLTKYRGEKTTAMNAVERMKFHSQITEAHLSQLKKFIPPFEALYASMSDEQKKTTDTLFKKGKNRKNKRK
jgi:hypothetical protein